MALLVGLGMCAVARFPTAASDTRGAPVVSFRNRACGITFTVPSGWTVSVSYPKGLACNIEITPPPENDIVSAAPGTPDEPCHFGNIHIRVHRKSFEAVALEIGFTKERDEWHYMAGSVFDNVTLLNGNNWRGVRASETSHICGAAHMFHEFVLGHGSRAVSIGATDQNERFVEELLRTLTVPR
jgi:hypothetical protein